MATSTHPDPNVNWPHILPISGIPDMLRRTASPTSRNTCVVERQLGANTVLSANYVGKQGHRLLVMEEANPGDPALCLSLSQPREVASGSATCGPFGESNVFTTASGQIVHGTRGPLGSDFGSDTEQATIGKSNYNALQVTVGTPAGAWNCWLDTPSASPKTSSSLGEEVNPFDPRLARPCPLSM